MSNESPHGFNIFCRCDEPDIRCAVPEERPVPTFLKGPIWQFSGKTDAVALGTVVLGERVIADAVRAQGYYIFQRIGFPG